MSDIGIAVHSATDVAKSCASVILTTPGIDGIVDLIQSGRSVHRRVLTWTMNKITKAFQTNIFICVIFLLTGRLVVEEKHLVFLLFFLDLVTLALSTDNVDFPLRLSSNIEHEKIILLCSILGLVSILEFMILYRSISEIMTVKQLQTIAFEMLFFFGMLNVLCFRSKGFWWKSMPGRDLILAVGFDTFLVFLLVHSRFSFDIEFVKVEWTFLIFLY